MQPTQLPEHVISPRWSPDSKEIVFQTEAPNGHDSIHRISAADGTRLWFLPNDNSQMNDVNWSPAGKRVLWRERLQRIPLRQLFPVPTEHIAQHDRDKPEDIRRVGAFERRA